VFILSLINMLFVFLFRNPCMLSRHLDHKLEQNFITKCYFYMLGQNLFHKQ